MLIDVSKKELEVIINQLWKSRKSEEQVGEVYERLKPFLDICACKENITADDDYSSKVDALVDGMSVTDQQVAQQQ